MEETVKIELTEREREIICHALDYWSDGNPYIDDETYNKAIELIERITNVY